MASVVLVVLIILNIAVTWTVVRCICMANGTEIAIKTTLGYSVVAKFNLLFILNLLTILINGIFCLYFGITYFADACPYMLAGIILVLIFDCIVTLTAAWIWEKRSTVKALKGAIL